MIRSYSRFLFVLTVLFFISGGAAYSQINKSNLNVLYVGGSGDIYDQVKLPEEAKQKDIRERMAAFENMLNKYFNKVTTVHINNYKSAMSADYDVTVIDAMPEKQPGEKYDLLPEDFTGPVLFIGETSVKLTANHGSKFDWYCLCLRGDAFNIKTQHPIFKGPFPVKITTTPKPLPAEASLLNYRKDKTYPSPIATWSVQTGSYDDANLQQQGIQLRPGLICHGAGFEDSPDAEYIAGGSSAKDAGALAIGRHGNFFHWGFAASPRYLTAEGQTVLANAIVYASKFKGKKVIAKKFSDHIQTTYDITGKRDALSEKARNLMNEYYSSLAKQAEDRKKKAEAKKASGAALSPAEEYALKAETKAPEPVNMEDYLRATQRELYSKFGADLKAYQKYYDENLPYFYSDGKGNITIDEDLKSLKIKRGDIKLLDAAIKLWETGRDTEKGQRILSRYTLATFTKPQEWRKWYNENKARFFFTESGGYYYLINTEDNVEGNDYKKKQKQVAYNQIIPGGTTDENPVAVAAGIVPLENGKKEIVVRLKIHPGYHIYGYVSEKDPFIKTEVNITPPKGYKSVGELKAPVAILYNQNNTSVYKDEAAFVQKIEGSGPGEVECLVSYQCCNDNICYPPVEEKLIVKL